MLNTPINAKAEVSASIVRGRATQSSLKVGGIFNIECYDKDGNLKWSKKAKNGVVNVGLDDQLDTYFNSGSQITTWFIGILNTGASLAATDTASSHAGWTEYVNYTSGTRPTWTSGAASGQAVTNGTSVDFTIDSGGGTVAGAFLISNSTKGGSTGILYCTAILSGGDQVVNDTDVIRVTYTVSMAST